MAQVEPLHFSCHAVSNGTKMEKIDPCMSTSNIGAPLYDGTVTNNNGVPDIKTIHQTYVSIPMKEIVIFLFSVSASRLLPFFLFLLYSFFIRLFNQSKNFSEHDQLARGKNNVITYLKL